jgi:hypothetical protein
MASGTRKEWKKKGAGREVGKVRGWKRKRWGYGLGKGEGRGVQERRRMERLGGEEGAGEGEVWGILRFGKTEGIGREAISWEGIGLRLQGKDGWEGEERKGMGEV